MALVPPRPRKWSRQKYHRMVEVGLLLEEIEPLAAPGRRLRVEELLPRR